VVIGGGAKGTVQTAVDLDTGKPVAVKSVQADKGCPIRFLQFVDEAGKEFHAEGYVPQQNDFNAWHGKLAFDPQNAFGINEFDDSVQDHVVMIRRGGASFFAKVEKAALAGARGVIFINEDDSTEVYSFGNDNHLLPSVMVTRSDGDRAIAMLQQMQAGTSSGIAHVKVRTDVGHEALVSQELPLHGNVVEVLDAWEEGDAAIIVMHLCQGGPAFQGNHALRQRFFDGWLSQALNLVRQMLEGLAHLHQHGICHRDLKPENLLLTDSSENRGSCRVKIADFSMASRASRLWVPCGSPKYLAPEVLTGVYSMKRDVWSAGVMAYELLFGRNPLGPTDKEALQRLQSPDLLQSMHLEANPRDGISDEVVDLLKGLLEPEAERRLSAAEALKHPALLA